LNYSGPLQVRVLPNISQFSVTFGSFNLIFKTGSLFFSFAAVLISVLSSDFVFFVILFVEQLKLILFSLPISILISNDRFPISLETSPIFKADLRLLLTL